MPYREKIAGLIEWFEKKQRPFPWRKLSRESPSFAYAVWVSEVMLQQTRAEVVVPYFSVWMQKYPTLERLAQAPLDEVIKTWEGLGYYSRARRLWQGAKYLLENHQGRLPESYDELLEIPGFGPYTAGAVASFAFHKKAVAVDGNVARVVSRLFSIEEPIDKTSVQREVRQRVFELLPDSRPWVAMEALIELGAMVCAKKPQCSLCPLRQVCLGNLQGSAGRLPTKQRKEKTEKLYRDVAVLLCGGKILAGKVQKDKVMADLYEFPYFERGKLQEWLTEEMRILRKMDRIEHSFTRFRVFLFPYLIQCEKEISLAGYNWIPMDKLQSLPFSAGHRKILGWL